MMMFEGIILQPGENWSEEKLREIAPSIIDELVTEDSYGDTPVGVVTDSEYVDGEGVQCTLEIHDERIAELLEQKVISIAPTLVQDGEAHDDAKFSYAFATPSPTDDVGEFDRKI